MRCTIGSTIEENTEITFFLLGSQYFAFSSYWLVSLSSSHDGQREIQITVIHTPQSTILVRNGRLAKSVARQSSFRFRSGTL